MENKKRNKLTSIISIGFFLLFIFVLFSQASDLTKRLFYRFGRSKIEHKYGILEKISVGINIEYLKSILGTPAFINQLKEEEESEFVFVDDYYYVQAVVDKDGEVISLVMVSRSEDFNPLLGNLGVIEAILNKTTFSEIKESENYKVCYRFQGANTPQYYFEESFFGNAGNYLTYLVGISDAGSPVQRIPDYDSKDMSDGWQGEVDCSRINKEQRDEKQVNTFITWSPEVKTKYQSNIPIRFFGPNLTQVRLLP
ncbi:MAG: ETEC_3214 domain-containing protein [Patescibacteria group bacterium]